MELHYSVKLGDESRIAKAMGRDLNISFKHSVAICKKLKGAKLSDALTLLDAVVAMKKAIPFTRFKKGIGHRKGLKGNNIAKYPQKAAAEISRVLRNAETNADYKGLNLEQLKISHIQAQKGVSRAKRKPKGRWATWKTQLVNVQVVLKEFQKSQKKAILKSSKKVVTKG